ncbi:MAG TPA: hypothetical protein VLF94_00410 [Chlamydiales bacterium]|nr:hypothetical protein [Chlamydiales bacterium]
MLNVGVLGINFKTADLQLREAIARGAQSLSGERSIFFRHPIVVLSTCNRTEIYFSADDLAEAHSDLLAHLRTQVESGFEHRLYSYFGIDCFAHLCRVASGLDSAILSETEIQRQVKVAYAHARNLPSCLHYVFQKALRVGKAIRNQPGLRHESPTLYGTLWQLAEWRKRRILLVGYSEINRGFASFLMHKGVRRFSLCTRYPASVRLEEVHVYDRSVLDRWQEFDLIVCASQSERFLIVGEGEPRHSIFDLSVPRNVDPEVGKSSTLYNIDQLVGHNGSMHDLERREDLLWEHVVRLTRIFRIKTRHAQGIEETGLHLVYSPSR